MKDHQEERDLPSRESKKRKKLDPGARTKLRSRSSRKGSNGSQLSLVTLEDFAFDEMNIVETPFALLSNTSKVTNIELSPEGHEYLGTTSKNGALPTSLAEPVVLGLMWLSMRQNNFRSPVTRFSLRDLICNYVFPDRYNDRYTPSAKILRAVELQINRVADTRIHTDRWYDKKLGKTTRMNAAIIDYVQVIEEGGKNKPRILEMRWGEKFYRSITEKYTKPIDPALLQRIETPLDRRLFRWLDRQLALKPKQLVRSCQHFARFKLLMTGQKVEAGGRTASSYITRRLQESLKRLDGIGFSVKLIVDESTDDYSLVFVKQGERGPNVFVSEDRPGELVREFQQVAHGVDRYSRRRRIAEADRAAAEEWIEVYGYEKAVWMVGHCVEIQRAQGAERILTFRGLERYEQAAAGDYEREQSRHSGQIELDLSVERERRWRQYEAEMLEAADKQISEEELAQIRAEAERELKERDPEASEGIGRKVLFNIEVKKRILERVGAMSHGEFIGYETEEELQNAIEALHGTA